ncbi:PREDICTED: angiopoietin-4 isoform X1 [Colobus angolensis palliatus]|uniref:Fibrinogen C-terminal domain-containing protein n=1 Tax=Colobus angolensis palliatus TaxID=336983 RepID=A0A2K5JFC5_COLAP|nr:PREDICTED: angiopoietin-4 isoform X1 [Colobus angolensis palliatus]
MLSQLAKLRGSLLLMVVTVSVAQQTGQEAGRGCETLVVQHGHCSYTFLLPKPEPCPPGPEASRDSNTLQRESLANPLHLEKLPTQQVKRLEQALQNNTQWLKKLERAIKMILRSKLVQVQQQMAQNQTAPMLELGTSLLNQTTAQTRKLTDMEAQLLNQTSRMDVQMPETFLSTNKLENQLLLQRQKLQQLQGQNSELEKRLQALETKQQEELASILSKKAKLLNTLSRQSAALTNIERGLRRVRHNSSLLQDQQRSLSQLLVLLRDLVQERANASAPAFIMAGEQVFQDCAEIQRSGASASGVYTIQVSNATKPRKVFCDLQSSGGRWTLIQRRENGTVNFQRNWKDYKQGFGDPAGEHWLGNEVVHQLTRRAAYSLRVELQDWEGHEAYAQYEHFHLGSENQLYRLSVVGYSGSAGRQSSLVLQNTSFSTLDSDNDHCLCKCAQVMSGGWWFDACGLSNLNGVYYHAPDNKHKMDGIRWHYFKGPSYSLRASRMMIRPLDI